MLYGYKFGCKPIIVLLGGCHISLTLLNGLLLPHGLPHCHVGMSHSRQVAVTHSLASLGGLEEPDAAIKLACINLCIHDRSTWFLNPLTTKQELLRSWSQNISDPDEKLGKFGNFPKWATPSPSPPSRISSQFTERTMGTGRTFSPHFGNF